MYTHIHTTCSILCAAAYSAVQSCKRPLLHYTNILFTQRNLHALLVQTHSHTLNISLSISAQFVTLLPTFPCFNRTSLKGQQFILRYMVDTNLALFRVMLERIGMVCD